MSIESILELAAAAANPSVALPKYIGQMKDLSTYLEHKRETQKQNAGPEPTADMQNYEAAKASGFTGSFADYQTMLKRAGRSQTNVTVEGAKPTKVETEMDKLAAKGAYEWVSGGAADSAKQISQLAQSLGVLNSDQKVTGVLGGNAPDALLAVLAPEAKEVRDSIAEVVQRNLRVILGAQFTEKEGKALIERAFDPRLPQDTQAKRVARLLQQMQMSHDAKTEMVRYIQQNRTLAGYKGSIPTMADFDQAVGSVGGSPTQQPAGSFEQLPGGIRRWNPSD